MSKRLDPRAPGLDEMTRRRREVLARLQEMSTREVFNLAVRAGIYTEDGALTEPYSISAGSSPTRPTD